MGPSARLTFVVLFLQCAIGVTLGAKPLDRVRASDARVKVAIRLGMDGSRTFRELFDRLQRSDVVLYVEPDACCWLMERASLALVVKAGETRYLRAKVSSMQATRTLIVQIGHEMRHAVEIADRREIVDAATMKQFYKRAGWYQCSGGCGYETVKARETSRAIRNELREARLTAPRPAAAR